MLVGEEWISRPKRVLYTAILIPLLGVPGTASEITRPESGLDTIAALAVGEHADQIGLSAARSSHWRQAARGLELTWS